MNEITLLSLEGLTPGDSTALEAEAQFKLVQAQACETPIAAAKLSAEAWGLQDLAKQLREPPIGLPEPLPGRGGEIAPLPDPHMPMGMKEAAKAVHAPPDLLAAEASMGRLSLLREAGVLTEAVDAAESIGAEGAIEQMLVHEIVAGHRLSMRLTAAAGNALGRSENLRHTTGAGSALMEANRTALAAARLMDSVVRMSTALDRLQNGGRQHVTVQHLVVAEGGQAVVTGSVAVGGKRRGRGRGPQ